MDFDLTDEQELLRDTTRELLTRSYDVESRNRIIDTDPGFNREVWAQLAEIGILSLGFEPEESGQIELMVVLTEFGRRLAPEPLAAAALVPGTLLSELGSHRELLDDISSGSTLVALAIRNPGCVGSVSRSPPALRDKRIRGRSAV